MVEKVGAPHCVTQKSPSKATFVNSNILKINNNIDVPVLLLTVS